MMVSGRTRGGFFGGLAASLPVAIGYFPIALSFGVAATQSGLGAGEATFLSLVVYAGASQFVALALLAGGSPVVFGIVMLLAMNARHLFYGPALLASLGGPRPLRYAALWSFGLTDEVFATTLGLVKPRVAGRELLWSEAWMSGIGAGAYLAWVGGTAVGGALGGEALAAFPVVEAGLEFMLPALFVALLLSLVTKRMAVMAGVAAAVSVLTAWLFSATTGVLAGMVVGALFGSLRRPVARQPVPSEASAAVSGATLAAGTRALSGADGGGREVSS